VTSSKVPSEISRKVNPDEQQFLTLNQQVFAELLTFVDFAEGFTLGLLDINFSTDAKVLLEALKEHPRCQGIQFECFDFTGDPGLRFLRDALLKELQEVHQEPDKKLVLVVLGLEKAIGISGDYPPVLQDLNFVRDAYQSSTPHPLLLVLPDYAITRLAKFAPDFWAWKSGVFLFKTPQTTQEYARSQTIDAAEPIGTSGKPESPERIELLERLLMDYRPDGSSSLSDNDFSTCNTILHQLGLAYLAQPNPQKAQDYLEEALKLAQRQNDTQSLSEIHQTLGRTYTKQRLFEKAKYNYELALEDFRNLKDDQGVTKTLFYVGNLYLVRREFVKAKETYLFCLDNYEKSGNRYSQAFTYHNLGIASQELHEYEKARQYYQQALDIYVEYDDRYEQARIYNHLGLLAKAQEEYTHASTHFLKALEIFAEYKDEYSMDITLRNLARLYRNIQDKAIVDAIAVLFRISVEEAEAVLQRNEA
jgi:tetratricopeptide (TPR) repeat protein